MVVQKGVVIDTTVSGASEEGSGDESVWGRRGGWIAAGK